MAMNRLEKKNRVHILNLLLEGNSIRGAGRLTGVSPVTILKLLIDTGNACARFHDKFVRGLDIKDRIELDEMWKFIYAKEKNVSKTIDPPKFVGDAWTHIALDSRTKMIVSYRIGKRDPRETLWLIKDVRKRVVGMPEFASDGYPAYEKYARKVFGDDVSLANIVGRKKIRISGNPDMESIGTTYVERHNLTMRENMKRYSRQTLAFSKKVEYMRAHLHLYAVHYNWCRIHETLRVSPAMEAGLCDVLHDVDFIVDLTEARTPLPEKRGPYKKRAHA